MEPTTDIKERAFEFSVRICRLCRTLEAESQTSKIMANQLLRSGTSIGANLEEAQAGQSKADFISKIFISCKEARETNYWLRLLVATETLPRKKLNSLIDESNQLIAILTSISKNARANS